MADIIQIRRDTAGNWTGNNPTLANAELGYETDTNKWKVGDAVTAWNDLNYILDRTKTIIIKVMAADTVVTQADGLMKVRIPIELNGMNLVSVAAYVYTKDAANAITVDIYNYTDGSDMLSTPITIDANTNDSKDAGAPPVIDAGEDDVVTGDIIGVDVTTYAGAAAKGLEVSLGFYMP